LTSHSDASNESLVAYESYDEPRLKKVVKVTPDKKVIGPVLKGDAKAVYDYLEHLSEEKAISLKEQLEATGYAPIFFTSFADTLPSVSSESAIKLEGGKEVVIKKDMVSIAAKEEKVSGKLSFFLICIY